MSLVLVTGSAGFLGAHLVSALIAGRHTVLGADLRPTEGVESFVVKEEGALCALLEARRPELIIHGAFANRRPEGSTERAYLDGMIASNLSLFEAAARNKCRVLLISSSAVYGKGGGRETIDESCPPEPVSLYGVAKTTQELLGGYQVAVRGLDLSIVRLFNLCGPGQGLGMLLPDWVSRAVAIARGGEPVFRVPTIRTSRDFVDVRDAARAIVLLSERFQPGSLVNVASGQATSLGEVCDHLRSLCPVPFEVLETAPAPDASNVLAQRGASERIRSGWGWSPEIDWQRSLADLWQEWFRRQ